MDGSTVSTAVTQASRRGRTERNSQFVVGSIIRINVQNFLTYDQCTFRFNPKLNVIIGPNGTGKSSIVCAICIGLAGRTSLLARAKEIGDYIQHGKQQATIEVELYNVPHCAIIRRTLNHGQNGKTASTWHLNGNQVNVKQIEETVGKLNIQLSNLCQFLPQERVSDFSKMNKIELLENTQQAVCSTQMLEDHKWLKDFRLMEKEMDLRRENDQVYLDKLKQKNERVEQDVVRYKERKKLIDQLDTLDKKHAWTVYEATRNEFVEKKKICSDLHAKNEEAKKETLPYVKSCEKLMEKMVEINKSMSKTSEELKATANKTKTIHNQINDKDESVAEKWSQFKELEKDENGRMEKIDHYKLQINGWTDELDQLDDTDVDSDINDLNHKIHATVTAIANFEQETNSIIERGKSRHWEIQNCEKRLAKLNNMSSMRLEMLHRLNKHCYNAIIWLRENKGMFKGVIHEPIILLINMKDPKHAELVENHIAMRDLQAFVCEESEDNDLFIRELREKQNIKINVVKAPRSNGVLISSKGFQPKRQIKDLKKWGFTSYLRDLFDAPDSVMAFLCKQYRVHDVPIGSELTRSHVEQVTQTSGIGLFFIPSIGDTPGCRYSVKRSKYSSNCVVGNTCLRKPQCLNINIDPVEIETVQNEIHSLKQESNQETVRLQELKKKTKTMEIQDNELRKKKKSLQQQMNQRKTLQNKIKLKEANVAELETSFVNLEDLREQVQQEVNEIILERRDLVIKFVKTITECVDKSVKKGWLQAKYAARIRQKTKVEEKIYEVERKNVELKRRVESAEEDKKELQKQAKQLLAEAKKKTGGNPDHMSVVFSSLPNSLTDIENMMHDYRSRLECCGDTDPKAFEEFNSRKAEIEKLYVKVSKLEKELLTHRADRDVVRDRWISALQKIISKVNSSFSKYFAAMGCSGEVDLHTDFPDDFDKYGIRIRVKFRASSSLQELNPFRQSGGERSVSTMLYLVALQSIYNCPFRLVDEINQGMDPYNERRVFEVIVSSSSEASTSQYFLITPKLLPNLTYNNHMSVHCVYNGAEMLPHNNWKISRFIRRRKQLKYEDEE
ncbi:structural maintenance of chromosomes protein 5-like [Ciona intestinalis]